MKPEKSIEQIVEDLPPGHRARRDLAAMQASMHASQLACSVLAFACLILILVLILLAV